MQQECSSSRVENSCFLFSFLTVRLSSKFRPVIILRPQKDGRFMTAACTAGLHTTDTAFIVFGTILGAGQRSIRGPEQQLLSYTLPFGGTWLGHYCNTPSSIRCQAKTISGDRSCTVSLINNKRWYYTLVKNRGPEICNSIFTDP